MFERFTNAARRVVVLSQEEARELGHNYIGTEHLVLGLLREDRGLAGKLLAGQGMTLAAAREDAVARAGKGKTHGMTGHIPFTPRAKKVLEGSLREALALEHNYIGTEHLLLGVLREPDGIGAKMLDAAGGPDRLRALVLAALPNAAAETARRTWTRVRPGPAGGPADGGDGETEELRTTPAADSGLDEATRLAGVMPVGSHHLVLAALTDPATAATKALAALGIDLDRVRSALRNADVTDSTDELPEEAGRRQMIVRPGEDRVTIELTDPVIVRLAADTLAATSASDGPESQPAVIRGDQLEHASLGKVWLALRDSLEDIRRAVGAGQAAAHKPGAEPPAEGSAGQEPGEPAAGSSGG